MANYTTRNEWDALVTVPTVWKAPIIETAGANEHYPDAEIEEQAKIVERNVNTENYTMAYALLKFMQQGYFASFTDTGSSIDLRDARRYILAFNKVCDNCGISHRRLA